MRNPKRERHAYAGWITSLAAIAGLAACGYPAPDGQLDPRAQARALGRGVNFGNLLDATPQEGAWTNGQVITASDFALAAAAGFDSVRLPVRFAEHALADPPYTIDEAFLARVEQVVGWGLARGLRVVIDLHHYEALMADPQGQRARFAAIWKQIARRFRTAPDGLYYELLNEPSDPLTPELWNDVLVDGLVAIRRIDRHHTIVVGCAGWGNSWALPSLVLPQEETNAIVTFHFYSPTLFVFQGKQEWMGPDWSTTGITWPGPPSVPVTPAPGLSDWVVSWLDAYNTVQDPDQNPGGPGVLRDEIATAAAWGEENGRPLWMGEFTAQDGADLASRARWMSFVRTELESQGIPWSFWTLDSDRGTRLYDPETRLWTLELTQALGLDVTND